ncbi:MAG TPA: 20S proteasome subunit A/B [Verrucomicrobiae bacterium]|nr:20S proteasome subunit A/B [Verrucomicrobiae bacterium]
MTEEPYRWLEAIGNRREYIRDQLKGGTPVFAVSRPEGILLVGVGQGQSKVFEIYDRHAFAALGHPVDIEKLRQAAIEAAHLEGFNRSSRDVTLRRLISFSLSSMLKNAFEQVFSPPFIAESIFAELGARPEEDSLVRVHFDGDHHYETSGVLVAHREPQAERESAEWLRTNLRTEDSLEDVVRLCLTAYQALAEDKGFANVSRPTGDLSRPPGKVIEAALLDRQRPGPVHYRKLEVR